MVGLLSAVRNRGPRTPRPAFRRSEAGGRCSRQRGARQLLVTMRNSFRRGSAVPSGPGARSWLSDALGREDRGLCAALPAPSSARPPVYARAWHPHGRRASFDSQGRTIASDMVRLDKVCQLHAGWVQRCPPPRSRSSLAVRRSPAALFARVCLLWASPGAVRSWPRDLRTFASPATAKRRCRRLPREGVRLPSGLALTARAGLPGCLVQNPEGSRLPPEARTSLPTAAALKNSCAASGLRASLLDMIIMMLKCAPCAAPPVKARSA